MNRREIAKRERVKRKSGLLEVDLVDGDADAVADSFGAICFLPDFDRKFGDTRRCDSAFFSIPLFHCLIFCPNFILFFSLIEVLNKNNFKK